MQQTIIVNNFNFHERVKKFLDEHGWSHEEFNPAETKSDPNDNKIYAFKGFITTHFDVVKKGMFLSVNFYRSAKKLPEASEKIGSLIYKVNDFIQ